MLGPMEGITHVLGIYGADNQKQAEVRLHSGEPGRQGTWTEPQEHDPHPDMLINSATLNT